MAGSMKTSDEYLCKLKTDLQRHLEKQLIKGDTWYLIDNHWFKQCKLYVGFEETLDNIGGTEQGHPGPIDNRSLFNASGEIREHMSDDLEYVLVPEEGWNMLVEQFGLEEDQEPIRRKVVEHGMFIKYCKVEVYFIEFRLAENSNLELVVKKKFSKTDNLEHIEKVMREEFNIDERVETRLWHKYISALISISNTYEQLAGLENTVQEAGLFSGQNIIIEKKNEDGTWPRTMYRGIEAPFSYPGIAKTSEGRVENAAKELEDRSSSIKNLLLKEVKDVKDGVKNQYITKIEEINRKIGDEENSVETWNGKRKELKAKQTSENSNMKNKHRDEKKKLEKKHQDEEAIVEKKHRVEEEEMRNKYENDGLYLASLKEVRNQLARDVDKLDMEHDNDHKNLEDARGTLECPVCLEAMKPPTKIWMCPLSHIVCELCKNKLEGRLCPSCRTNQVTQRAIVAENFARCVFNK